MDTASLEEARSDEQIKQLLQMYEPILKFHPDEQFFPIAVEDYLLECRLLKTRRFMPPLDLTDKWQAWGIADRKHHDADMTNSEEQTAIDDMGRTLKYFDNDCFLQYVQPPSVRSFLTEHWLNFVLAAALAIFALRFFLLNRYWLSIVVLYLAGLWFVQSQRGQQILKMTFPIYILWTIGSFFPVVRYLIIPFILWTAYRTWRMEKSDVDEQAQVETAVTPPIRTGWSEMMDTPTDRVLVFTFLAIILFSIEINILGDIIMFGRYSLPSVNVLIGIILLVVALPGLPGFLVDVTSKATGEQVNEAVRRAAAIRKKRMQLARQQKDSCQQGSYTYYGRIVEESGWTILQYQYFYAFNDWRSRARGLNNHEADWETIAIYLPTSAIVDFKLNNPPRPYGVAFSQHHDGAFRFWHTLETGRDHLSGQRTHPVTYVALGSHANYPVEIAYRMTEMIKRHPLQWVFSVLIELPSVLLGLVQEFGLTLFYDLVLFNKPAAERDRIKKERLQKVRDKQSMRSILPIDYAIHVMEGRDETLKMGLVVGPITRPEAKILEKEISNQGERKNIETLAKQMMGPKWRNRTLYQFTPVVLSNSLPGWVEFPGLWGSKTILKDESGPTGPKWARAKRGKQLERIRWQKPVRWLSKIGSD